MNKVFSGALDALHDVDSNVTIMLGGFGLCGIPENSIAALAEKKINNLTCISNNAGVDDFGLGLLLKTRQIKKMISSYVGENAEFERQFMAGELELEFNPQGTLAERLRAGGAGIPAFFTPAGVGTPVADGGLPWRYHADGSVALASPPKETREFGDKRYVMELGINADFALVHAVRGDTAGN